MYIQFFSNFFFFCEFFSLFSFNLTLNNIYVNLSMRYQVQRLNAINEDKEIDNVP